MIRSYCSRLNPRPLARQSEAAVKIEAAEVALRLWRRQERVAWLRKGQPRPEWVFASVTGTALDESNVRKALNRVLDAAGLHRRGRIRCGTRLRRCFYRTARRSPT